MRGYVVWNSLCDCKTFRRHFNFLFLCDLSNQTGPSGREHQRLKHWESRVGWGYLLQTQDRTPQTACSFTSALSWRLSIIFSRFNPVDPILFLSHQHLLHQQRWMWTWLPAAHRLTASVPMPTELPAQRGRKALHRWVSSAFKDLEKNRERSPSCWISKCWSSHQSKPLIQNGLRSGTFVRMVTLILSSADHWPNLASGNLACQDLLACFKGLHSPSLEAKILENANKFCRKVSSRNNTSLHRITKLAAKEMWSH